MGFFLCFLISVAGFALAFLPLEIPLYLSPAVAATGWVLARLLQEKTPTDRRLRRLSGLLALLSAALALIWHLVLWILIRLS